MSVHAVCCNEDREGDDGEPITTSCWRVTLFHLSLHLNAMGLLTAVGSRQFAKGTNAGKATLRSVLCRTAERWKLKGDF